MQEYKDPEQLNENELICKNCGGKIEFKPGSTSVICPYCGTENEITFDEKEMQEALKEIDYYEFIKNNNQTQQAVFVEESFVQCPNCGASMTIDANTVSTECPYCGSPIVREQKQLKKIIQPQALLPFVLDKKAAMKKFNTWMKKSFWAPKKAKLYAKPEKLQGVYAPYWTFDADTTTDYTGERGDDYEETSTDADGNETTTTETRWTRVRGTVYVSFDDLPVLASNSLKNKYISRVSSFDYSQLKPYKKQFLSGFKNESYTIEIQEGFERAKIAMDFEIEAKIKQDIGGDHQRILSKNTAYNNVTFKHILAPLWISSYQFKGKVYNFVVNGQTGAVSGKRPVDAMKVVLTILLAIIVIILLYLISK